MIRHNPNISAVLIAAAVCCGVGGCTGSATVHSMPFMRQDFSATEAPAQKVDADEAYYWIDEQKRVNVALRRHVGSLLGKVFEYDWRLSLVLEDLPAGSEKLYRLGVDSVRMLASYGGSHARAASLTGVAVIHSPRDGVMRGRFHADVRQQGFTVLTGWTPPLGRAPVIVMAGTFEAVYDPMRGKAIRERTEADGMERRFRTGDPTTHPAYLLYPTGSQPASRPILPLIRPTTAPSGVGRR